MGGRSAGGLCWCSREPAKSLSSGRVCRLRGRECGRRGGARGGGDRGPPTGRELVGNIRQDAEKLASRGPVSGILGQAGADEVPEGATKGAQVGRFRGDAVDDRGDGGGVERGLPGRGVGKDAAEGEDVAFRAGAFTAYLLRG